MHLGAFAPFRVFAVPLRNAGLCAFASFRAFAVPCRSARLAAASLLVAGAFTGGCGRQGERVAAAATGIRFTDVAAAAGGGGTHTRGGAEPMVAPGSPGSRWAA